MKKHLLLPIVAVFFILFLTNSSISFAQSFAGKDFWFAYMTNSDNATVEYQVNIISEKATKGKITVPLGTYKKDFTVVPGKVTTVKITAGQVANTGSDALRKTGVHLVADDSCIVYLGNYKPFTSDAATAIPTEALDTVYHLSAYANIQFGTPEFIIVATENNTNVNIDLGASTGAHNQYQPFSIKMKAGETYQLQSAGNSVTDFDFSGTIIRSDKPVAVYAGDVCVYVGTCPFCDHLYEQMRPVSSWGYEYYFSSLNKESVTTDVVRVYASQDNTTYTINGAPALTLNAREFMEYNDIIGGVSIVSNNPIHVSQYLKGSSCSVPPLAIDPLMLDVLSKEQFGSTYLFATSPYDRYGEHYATVVIEAANQGKLLLNGTPPTIAGIGWTPIGTSPYVYGYLELEAGTTYTLKSTNNSTFGVYVYGYGQEESYGYTGGGNIKNLCEVIVKDTSVCPGNAVKLKVKSPYIDVVSVFNWYDKDLKGTLLFTGDTYTTPVLNKTDTFWVQVNNNACNNRRARVIVNVFDNSAPTFTIESTTCADSLVKITYTGTAADTALYTWGFDGGTVVSGTGKGPYKVRWNTGGTKNVSLQIKQNGCTTAVTTNKVIVYPKMVLSPSSTKTSGCSAKDGSATVSATGGAGNYTYKWNTTPIQTTATASGLGSGSYTVVVSDTAGCSATIEVPVSDGNTTLTATIDNIVNPTCVGVKNGSADANPNAGKAPYTYLWSDGQTTKTATNLGSGDIGVTVTDANGCIVSATATLAAPNGLIVIANADTATCATGTVKLYASASGGNGSLSYAWTSIPAGFNATTLNTTDNPTISTQYILTVSDSKGCSLTDTVNVTVYPIPTADFNLPNSICLNVPVQLEYVGTASPTANYIWSFDSATVVSGSGAGPYQLSWAKQGTKQVTLTVIENGCNSTEVLHTIDVSNQATATFKIADANICIDGTDTVTYTGPVFSDAVYNWDFNGATVMSGADKGPYVLKWTSDGKKVINLSIATQTCPLSPYTDSLNIESITASFSSNPSMPAVISLQNSTNVNFTNESTSNANTFDWDFGDGTAHATDANPSHTYTTPGTYSVSLTATSTSGCTNSVTKGTIEILDNNTYLYIPNVFSLNAANNNGSLVITHAGIVSAKVNIFNRWGQLVFQTDNIDEFWNAKYKNSIVQEGTYIYVVTAKSTNGKTFNLNGTVQVMP